MQGSHQIFKDADGIGVLHDEAFDGLLIKFFDFFL